MRPLATARRYVPRDTRHRFGLSLSLSRWYVVVSGGKRDSWAVLLLLGFTA